MTSAAGMADRPSKEIVHERMRKRRAACCVIRRCRSARSATAGICLDPAYFSRFFTKRVGLPPSQFRLTGFVSQISACVASASHFPKRPFTNMLAKDLM